MGKIKVKRISIKTRNEELKSKLAVYLSKGLTLKEAQILAECPDDTLKGLRTDYEFESFIQQSLLRVKSDYLDSIKKAAKCGQWQAAAWYLERTYPEFRKQDIVRHEYSVKLQTLHQVILRILNEVDPRIKVQIVQAFREFKWRGEEMMTSTSFKPNSELPMLPGHDDDVLDI